MRLIAALVFCLVGVGVVIPPALAAQKVFSSLDLATDRKVLELRPIFEKISGTNVIYAHCNHVWLITPEQDAFQKVAFQRISAQYLQAFYDAYLKRVGSPPPSVVVNNYTKYVYNQQAKAMKSMVDFIGKGHNGCNKTMIARHIKFVERMRYDDMAEHGTLDHAPDATSSTTPPVPTAPAATTTTPTSGSH